MRIRETACLEMATERSTWTASNKRAENETASTKRADYEIASNNPADKETARINRAGAAQRVNILYHVYIMYGYVQTYYNLTSGQR